MPFPSFQSAKKLFTIRNMPLVAVFLVALTATRVLSGTAVDPYSAAPADDGRFLQLMGCTVSDSAFAPPGENLVVRYTIIGPDSVLVAVLLDSAGVQQGAIQSFVKQAPGHSYAVPFEGILRGVISDRILFDGFYDIRVRTFSDTGRVEQCRLPIEVDRLPPSILRYEVNGDTARTVTVQNGDTILIDAFLDRPSYSIKADFSKVDNDTAALFTSVLDQGGGHYTIRRFISEANTLPDGTGLPVTLTFADLAGNVLKDSSLLFCLSNRPPTLVSARIVHEDGNAFKNGSRITIETIWDSSDTLLNVTADFSGIDSRWAPANVSISRFTGNRHEIRYTISADNTIEDGSGYLVTFQAHDRACGVSEIGVITLDLDNAAGARPVLDPLPASTRSASVLVQGSSPGSRQVVVKRNSAVVDTAAAGEDGRFEISVSLVSGENTITAEGFDAAGNKTAVSLPATIIYLTKAYVTIPRRFEPGSTIEVGLGRTGESARIELWNLSGDLLTVLEDTVPRDLYMLAWDGRNSSGETVAAGPVIGSIQIHFPDGKVETMREAFVLVKP